jgi:hypothetical protein
LKPGEARELHHFAVLIGYGANAVNPYLAFETIEAMLKDRSFELTMVFKMRRRISLRPAIRACIRLFLKWVFPPFNPIAGRRSLRPWD